MENKDLFKPFQEYLNNGTTVPERLTEIWKNFYGNHDISKVISPLMQNRIKTEVIIFLSINPSLPPKDIKNAKTGFEPVQENLSYFIDSTYQKENEIPHFKKFYAVGKDFNWSAMELLYIRDSNQKTVEEIAKTNYGEIFISEQIKLTFDILNKINPIMVVVANAGTERLINNFANKLEFNRDFPCIENSFIYKINNIPFITIQSRYLGSPKWWNRDIKEEGKRLNNLLFEIDRVKQSFAI